MAKDAVFHHRVSGPLMRGMHHIPVDRTAGSPAFKHALSALRSGELVGVFPAATISRSFLLKDFKPGAVRMAAAAGVPVIPAVVWGGQRIFTKGLDFAQARHYSAHLGVFLSTDSDLSHNEDDPQRWHRYSYISNNANVRVDPTGERWFTTAGRFPQWVNPNADGTYTSPGEGWTEFVPTPERPWLIVHVEGGRLAINFGEDSAGAPKVVGPLATGLAEDASDEIILVLDTARAGLAVGRIALAAFKRSAITVAVATVGKRGV